MNTISSLCGTQNPVFQAGLGGIAGSDLAAAVSNAGGLGHLGGIRLSASALRDWIQQTHALTDKPFGVNLVPMGGGPDGFDAQLSVTIAEKPQVISLFWGDFSSIIPRIKAAGITAMVQVGSVSEAQKAAADGADIIIVQGIEAGGHVRGNLGLLTFLDETLKAVYPIPVLAAGGIGTNETVKAVLQMGAAGAWVGTRFVATPEALAHDIYKERLVQAGADDTVHEHFYSYGWPIGTPYRIIKPTVKGYRQFIAGGVRKQDTAAHARGLKLYAGQGVGSIRKVQPAADILAELGTGLY